MFPQLPLPCQLHVHLKKCKLVVCFVNWYFQKLVSMVLCWYLRIYILPKQHDFETLVVLCLFMLVFQLLKSSFFTFEWSRDWVSESVIDLVTISNVTSSKTPELKLRNAKIKIPTLDQQIRQSKVVHTAKTQKKFFKSLQAIPKYNNGNEIFERSSLYDEDHINIIPMKQQRICE